MERIRESTLQALTNRLNKLTGSPTESWTKNGDGQYKANIGNYHIDHAYGGVSLERMMNDGGGVTCPLGLGHVSKRELYEQIHAYIRGIEEGKRLCGVDPFKVEA